MVLFGGKSKSAAKSGAGQSVLIEDEASGHMIVMGAGWRTLVSGRNPQAAARQIIKPFKPTHYLFHRYHVGWCNLQGQLPARFKGKIFSAAMLVSKMHSGTNLYLIDLGGGRYWLALTRNNAPTATDEVLYLDEPSAALRRARELVEQFEGEFIAIHTDLDRSSLDGAKAFGLADLLGVPRSEEEEFKPAKTGGSIPTPVAAAGVVVIFGLVAIKGWEQYKTLVAPPPLPIIEDPDDPPDVAWRRQLEQVQAGLTMPQGASAYAMVRQSFLELPARAGGWTLVGARCERTDDLSARKVIWACVGNYRREGWGLTSQEMEAAAQRFFPGRDLNFTDLQSLQVRWNLIGELLPRTLADLPVQSDVNLYIMSVLQRGALAMSEEPKLRYEPQPIEAPKKKNGAPYTEQPSFELPELVRGELVLRGPMRAIDFAVTHLAGYSWKSFGIRFNGEVGDEIDLRRSAFDVEASGEWLGLRKAYKGNVAAQSAPSSDAPPQPTIALLR